MNNTIFAKTIRKLRDLGANKKGIFVCNMDLKKSFKVGDDVKCSYDFDKKELVVTKADNKGTHKVSFRKSEPDKPILDIKNKTVYELFKEAEKVEICFCENKVVVRLSTNQKLQNEREKGYGLTTFELFCGGATMTQMFKQAGFKPVGGIEINERCLDMAEHNHDFKYTILADIKDIHPTDYPKGVNTVLCGIPCTNFSQANKSMQEALKRKKEGIDTQDDIEKFESRFESEALVYYILEALRHINPQNIVFEEVSQFCGTNAYELLKLILTHRNYKLTETISEGSHTKRKRWTMVATSLKSSIDLTNILPETNKTIEDFLEIKSKDRDWKPKEDIQRLLTASRKPSIGIRSCLPNDKKMLTATPHRTRSTEPCLKKSESEELYSEFTDEEIANIHGLVEYKLKSVAKWNRYVLGNGVTDMFYHIALRLKQLVIKEYKEFKQEKATIELVA